MTEWNASEYALISGLQKAMAEEVLALLDLEGSERILDVGCGDGKITAEVAARVPRGTVVGVDSSRDMIDFASSHFGPAVRPNLRFEVADARRLPFTERIQSRGLFQCAPLGSRAGCGTPLHTLCDEVRWPGLASSCPGR